MAEYDWQPLTPAETGACFATWPHPWWIAGGWALDLFRDEVSRQHQDVDVIVLRRDLGALRQALPGWELHMADPPGTLRLWEAGEPFPPRAHDIWCRPAANEPWRVQVMVMDADDDRWFFRRDARISGPLATFGLERNGLPIISPELQLLYKAKGRRPRDEADFARTLPHLGDAQRIWLHDAIALIHPEHDWLDALAGTGEDRAGSA